MAPQNKREASPEQSEEVCKRIKDEVTKSDKSLSSNDVVKDEHEGNNNNNNNDAKVDGLKNGNTKNADGDSKQATEAAGDKAEQQKDDKSNALTNGEQKEVASKESDDAVKESSAPTDTTQAEQASVEKSKAEDEPQNKVEATSTTEQVTKEEPPMEEATTGILLMCGGANWDMTGRKELPKSAKKPVDVNPAARNLWGPHRVCLEDNKPLRVKGVFSGCNACHSVIVTDDGVTMTFGRNDKGQLGVGDTETRVTPVVVEALKGIDIVAAACGRSHTLFLDSDGIVYSCGDNKMGQCGTNQAAVHQITTPARVACKDGTKIVKVACGAEFSMIVDSNGRLYSFGHPEHGQLGHNSEGKYFTTGNKYAFHCELAPRRIVTFIEKARGGHVSPVEGVEIVDVACGTNHTLAVDKKNRCYSWGFAGYHRLGHSETKNELVPRSIKLFDAPPSTGRGAARVFAGATHSMALDCNGLLYFWGQNKSSGEATMYPKNVQDLCGWRIKAVSCANRSIFVIADEICVSWGPSPTYGELGYGEGKSKSSTTPQEVRSLDNVQVIDVACGFGHTLLMGRDRSPEERATLDKFKSWP